MPFDERKAIVESIKFVDEVIGFKMMKGSCINALEEIKKLILMMIFILLMVG